jgi:hypothetical protein
VRPATSWLLACPAVYSGTWSISGLRCTFFNCACCLREFRSCEHAHSVVDRSSAVVACEGLPLGCSAASACSLS